MTDGDGPLDGDTVGVLDVSMSEVTGSGIWLGDCLLNLSGLRERAMRVSFDLHIMIVDHIGI